MDLDSYRTELATRYRHLKIVVLQKSDLEDTERFGETFSFLETVFNRKGTPASAAEAEHNMAQLAAIAIAAPNFFEGKNPALAVNFSSYDKKGHAGVIFMQYEELNRFNYAPLVCGVTLPHTTVLPITNDEAKLGIADHEEGHLYSREMAFKAGAYVEATDSLTSAQFLAQKLNIDISNLDTGSLLESIADAYQVAKNIQRFGTKSSFPVVTQHLRALAMRSTEKGSYNVENYTSRTAAAVRQLGSQVVGLSDDELYTLCFKTAAANALTKAEAKTLQSWLRKNSWTEMDFPGTLDLASSTAQSSKSEIIKAFTSDYSIAHAKLAEMSLAHLNDTVPHLAADYPRWYERQTGFNVETSIESKGEIRFADMAAAALIVIMSPLRQLTADQYLYGMKRILADVAISDMDGQLQRLSDFSRGEAPPSRPTEPSAQRKTPARRRTAD